MTSSDVDEVFGDAWLETAAGSLPLPADAGGVVTVQLTVTGGPSGDVPTLWTISNGAAGTCIERSDDANAAFIIGWNDALAVLRGDLVPSVAYMQGRLKAAGDMNLVLSLLEYSTRPAFSEWRATLHP